MVLVWSLPGPTNSHSRPAAQQKGEIRAPRLERSQDRAGTGRLGSRIPSGRGQWPAPRGYRARRRSREEGGHGTPVGALLQRASGDRNLCWWSREARAGGPAPRGGGHAHPGRGPRNQRRRAAWPERGCEVKVCPHPEPLTRAGGHRLPDGHVPQVRRECWRQSTTSCGEVSRCTSLELGGGVRGGRSTGDRGRRLLHFDAPEGVGSSLSPMSTDSHRDAGHSWPSNPELRICCDHKTARPSRHGFQP